MQSKEVVDNLFKIVLKKFALLVGLVWLLLLYVELECLNMKVTVIRNVGVSEDGINLSGLQGMCAFWRQQ